MITDLYDFNTRTGHKSYDIIINKVKYNEIVFNAINDPKIESLIIETILLNYPLNALYFDCSNLDKWKSMRDYGLLSTAKNFVVDKTLKIEGLEILTELNGLGYDQLNSRYKRRIAEYMIEIHQISVAVEHVLIEHFNKRINILNNF